MWRVAPLQTERGGLCPNRGDDFQLAGVATTQRWVSSRAAHAAVLRHGFEGLPRLMFKHPHFIARRKKRFLDVAITQSL